MKTNAARVLERLGISYELAEYEVDPEDLSAETVAQKIGFPPEQVWKTLVVRGDRGGPAFAVVPAGTELDLKALARLSGNRSVEMVPLKDVQALTGYIRGGVTALAAKKEFPVYVDEAVRGLPRISVSAGMRGIQIIIVPQDYLRATRAVAGPIARRPASPA